MHVQPVSLHFSQVAHSYKLLGSVLLTQGKVEQARKYLTKVRTTCGKSIQPKMFYQLSLDTLYTTDAAVLAVAVPTLLVCAVAAVPDGVQTVLIGALRGASDVWPATALYVFAFWIVMVPLGYWLAVPRAMGAPGLMIAVAIGATLAAVLLGWRFRQVSSRAVRRA